jgi:hypothetical protein
VPDAASPSGLRHAATYLSRLDLADFVEEIEKLECEVKSRVYRERQKKETSHRRHSLVVSFT